ncbi:MAG TPA: triose-phosphate isomerase [Fimbriimonadaceae bacterium]|nr:triose-phosphate isomerase [Fimbriimonadaceae bacterium]
MRTKLVVGNWKMNNTIREAAAVVDSFIKIVDAKPDVDVVICPSYLAIPRVRELLRNTHIKVGAQDVFWEEKGAFTGQVSPAMLYDAGVSFCIVGHSETRGRFGKMETDGRTIGYFCETELTINKKIRSLLYYSITPILCVGETDAERNDGRTDSIIAAQLDGALEGLDAVELYGLVVAYEPVWAIGTGNTCDSLEAERVCAAIRKWLSNRLGEDEADTIRILYGGSVKASNSRDLFQQSNIDGGLVGGASLDPEEFRKIVMSA